MKDAKQSLDLSPLDDAYEIVGALDGRDDTQMFLATRKDATSKRRDDQSRVLITVCRSPEGDEGNALSHLAADTKTLSGTSHRRLVRVFDGRWIGKDAFAVITERVPDPTLASLLEKGETFSNPRTAAILREVNGLLEWAREQQIVNRTVTPDHVYLEPRSDRVRISFSVSAMSRLQRGTAADADARCIARLAVAMLTGDADAKDTDGAALKERRPDLPEQLFETTTTILDPKSSGADVPAFLALVGMADPLYAGETEADRVRAEVMEEQRVEREKLANERAEFERLMATERETFAREREAFMHSVASERDELHKSMAEDRERLLKTVTEERKQLLKDIAQERASLQDAVKAERAALAAKREEMERQAAARLAELERAAAADRASIEALRAELKRAGELEIERKREAALDELDDAEETALDDPEYVAPVFELPTIAPLTALAFTDDSELMRESEPLAPMEPVQALATPVVTPRLSKMAPDHTATPVRTTADDAPPRDPDGARKRRNWMIGGGAVALIAVVGASAMMMNNRPAPRRPAPAPAARTAPVVAAPVAPAPAVPLPVPSPSTQTALDSAALGAPIRDDSVRVAGSPTRVMTDAEREAAAQARAEREAAAARAAAARRAAAREAAARRAAQEQAQRDSAPPATDTTTPVFRPATPTTTSAPPPTTPPDSSSRPPSLTR